MTFVYTLFSALDGVAYSLCAFAMRLIIIIANYNFFEENQINELAERVYVILGVLVLFKIVISCIQYMVNPDTFDDRDKGMVGILKKTVICMALLVLTKPIFSFALQIQNTVVSTIPSLVMGTGTSNFSLKNKSSSDQLDDLSNYVATSTLKAFVSVKTDNNGNPKYNDEINDIDSFKEHIKDGCGWLFSDGKGCHYNYMWLFSTAAGVFLLYILLSMAIDVGIRSIKLGILQILAPIPISSYIVSKEKLSKFYKLAIKVYLDLFIRLIVIFFIIFFVREVIKGIESSVVLSDGTVITNIMDVLFVKVLIIIALFFFAKKAPQFICDALGLDGGGFGDIKDMFTRGAGLAGTTIAGIRTARSNYTAQKERLLGKNPEKKVSSRLRAAFSAAAGLGSATGRGLTMAAQGKGFKDVRMGASKAAINARNRRNERVDKLYNKQKYIEETDADGNVKKVKNPEYYGWWQYHRDVSREKRGVPSSEGFIKARYDAMEGIGKMAAEAKGHGVGKMNETPDKFKIKLSTLGAAGISISDSLGFSELSMQNVRDMYEMAKNGQKITTAKLDDDGNREVRTLSDDEITQLGTLVQNIEKRTSYLKEAELMATGDPAAVPNAEKIRIGIQTNKDMFSAPDIMEPIREKMAKALGSDTITINGKPIDIKTLDYSGLLKITEQLQKGIVAKPGTDAYYKEVDERANILLGLKDSFENVAKLQYRTAQLADNKAQKAQQAISNNEKKGS